MTTFYRTRRGEKVPVHNPFAKLLIVLMLVVMLVCVLVPFLILSPVIHLLFRFFGLRGVYRPGEIKLDKRSFDYVGK
jgi:hypothetical protein